MISIERVYQDWLTGEWEDREFLDFLAAQLSSIEDSIVPLEDTKKVLRAHISEVVERQGGDVKLEGYGRFQIRSATITKSYDAKALDQLIIELMMNGQVEVARAIGSCKKESSRTGGLVITKAKEASE
jgi:hypothetical protein